MAQFYLSREGLPESAGFSSLLKMPFYATASIHFLIMS